MDCPKPIFNLGARQCSDGLPAMYGGAFLFRILECEVCIRLGVKGVYPIKSDLGYMYFKDIHGRIIGAGTKMEFARGPKPNAELTEQEVSELKLFGLYES